MLITEMWLDSKTTSRGVEPTGFTAYFFPASRQGHAVVILVQISSGKEAPLPPTLNYYVCHFNHSTSLLSFHNCSSLLFTIICVICARLWYRDKTGINCDLLKCHIFYPVFYCHAKLMNFHNLFSSVLPIWIWMCHVMLNIHTTFGFIHFIWK